MKILSLNCQKAYNQNLGVFLTDTLAIEVYDFLLLQEVTEKVLEYVRPFGAYKLLTCEENNRPGLICIVYRNTIVLESSQHVLWPQFHSAEHSAKGHISFGAVSGIFTINEQVIQVASVHLPSGVSAHRRSKRLPEVTHMLDSKSNADTTFFGGDCNFCYPGELAKAERALSPDYECTTGTLPTTLNSCYTEKLGDSPIYRIVTITAYILSLLQICFKFKTDHLFVDKKTAMRANITTRVLPDRVSDHSPIELTVDMET